MSVTSSCAICPAAATQRSSCPCNIGICNEHIAIIVGDGFSGCLSCLQPLVFVAIPAPSRQNESSSSAAARTPVARTLAATSAASPTQEVATLSFVRPVVISPPTTAPAAAHALSSFVDNTRLDPRAVGGIGNCPVCLQNCAEGDTPAFLLAPCGHHVCGAKQCRTLPLCPRCGAKITGRHADFEFTALVHQLVTLSNTAAAISSAAFSRSFSPGGAAGGDDLHDVDWSCCVCLEVARAPVVASKVCGHVFCMHPCLYVPGSSDGWLGRGNSTCPLCRKPMTKSDLLVLVGKGATPSVAANQLQLINDSSNSDTRSQNSNNNNNNNNNNDDDDDDASAPQPPTGDGNRDKATHLVCSDCKHSLPRIHFSTAQTRIRSTKRKCINCQRAADAAQAETQLLFRAERQRVREEQSRAFQASVYEHPAVTLSAQRPQAVEEREPERTGLDRSQYSTRGVADEFGFNTFACSGCRQHLPRRCFSNRQIRLAEHKCKRCIDLSVRTAAAVTAMAAPPPPVVSSAPQPSADHSHVSMEAEYDDEEWWAEEGEEEEDYDEQDEDPEEERRRAAIAAASFPTLDEVFSLK